MDGLAAGFAIWRRWWLRTSLVAILPWLPVLVFTVLLMVAIGAADSAEDRKSFALGWIGLTMPYVAFADQVLTLSVRRTVRAGRMGIPPNTLREPRSLGWMVLSALVVTVLLDLAAIPFVIPVVALTPFVYVTAVVAGVERRALPGAMRRAFRLSHGFRNHIIQASLVLWAVRWAVTLALCVGADAIGPVAQIVAIGVAVVVNLVMSGLFAATQVAFYDLMIERHDDPAGALGKIFE